MPLRHCEIRVIGVGVVFLAQFLCGVCAAKVVLHGAGASFPSNVYRSWGIYFQAYRHKYMRVELTYDSIGSGGGKDAITKVT